MATHSGFRFLQGMMGPESPQRSPLAAPWTPALDGDSEIWLHTPVSSSRMLWSVQRAPKGPLWPPPRPQHYMGIRKSGCAPRFTVPAWYDGPREPPKFPFGRPLDPSIPWGFGNLATHSGFKFPHAMVGPESPQSSHFAAA